MSLPFNQIGAYTLSHFLGAGNAASVYQAYQGHQQVAIKVRTRSPEPDHESFLSTRFREGARLQSLMCHPHIVWLYEYVEMPQYQASVIELMQGGDLAQFLKQHRRLTQLDACYLGICIADALDHLHDLKVVHRDLKPENLLFAHPNQIDSIKLADFDVSKQPQISPDITNPGSYVGTLWYISPEQFDQKKPKAKADVYSLGMVLYEAASGGFPFEKTQSSMIRRFLDNTPILPVRHFAPDLSPALEWILERAIDTQPQQRIPNAATLATLLFAVEPSLIELYQRAYLMFRRTSKQWISETLPWAPNEVQEHLVPVLRHLDIIS